MMILMTTMMMMTMTTTTMTDKGLEAELLVKAFDIH